MFVLCKDGKVIARQETQLRCFLDALDRGLASAPSIAEELRPGTFGKYLASGTIIIPEAEHV